MKAKDTKEDKLRNEIERLRQRLAELERYEVELKQTDKALRDTETRFRTAIDSLPFDFFVGWMRKLWLYGKQTTSRLLLAR